MSESDNILHKIQPIRRMKHRLGLYGNKKKHRNKGFAIICIIVLSLSAAVYKSEKRIMPIAFKNAEAQLKNGLTSECNRILSEIIQSEVQSESILTENRDKDEKVTSVSVNFDEVNRIKTYSAEKIAEFLESRKDIVCAVPIGSIVSDGILSGYGFKIPLKMMCIADFDINFDDDFISAGVNHVRHRLMIKVVVNAKVYSGFESVPVCIITDIPIAETVISGDIPVLNNQSVDAKNVN